MVFYKVEYRNHAGRAQLDAGDSARRECRVVPCSRTAPTRHLFANMISRETPVVSSTTGVHLEVRRDTERYGEIRIGGVDQLVMSVTCGAAQFCQTILTYPWWLGPVTVACSSPERNGLALAAPQVVS